MSLLVEVRPIPWEEKLGKYYLLRLPSKAEYGCHLLVPPHIFRSRLGCQICLTKFMDNMTVQVPDAMADVRQSIDVGKNS
uniref:Ferredoxin 1 n=1 Tax=Rousettus aegyptiacus TaxID=9407 RepID=A0A7J8GYG5_ROUAE|nr:ferredoxin 1 [Rousettus aegyptiacus]